ncbi:hypothetical protein RJ640_000304 [Escallonia rubra]|uniref:Right handed beta helix domain-containing protein n=1 Tax=Escallonia rubra TaxID=112253 RepID=A0AA88RL23_9ASTE|nr:hypothetical protein RJ640_000304 [Escallonia rubra]
MVTNFTKTSKAATVHGDSFSERKDQSNGIYYEDITFRDILFDSSYQGGGLLVIDSARVHVNNCFFIHFTTEGILVQRGHETFMSDCFLGEHSTVGGDRGERNFSGTAIDLASTDNAVTDVAIFSAATGIILRSQANIVTGVHFYNKATYFGGVGILVKAAQTRIANCYMDYNAIVIEDPAQVHVTNGFFLGGGNVLLKSVNGLISGLNIVNNMFSGDKNNMLPIVNLNGEFTNVDQVVIDHNNVVGMSLKSTVGKLSVAGNGTRWVADFSSVLVFPNRINHVQYSFYIPRGESKLKTEASTKEELVDPISLSPPQILSQRLPSHSSLGQFSCPLQLDRQFNNLNTFTQASELVFDNVNTSRYPVTSGETPPPPTALHNSDSSEEEANEEYQDSPSPSRDITLPKDAENLTMQLRHLIRNEGTQLIWTLSNKELKLWNGN